MAFTTTTQSNCDLSSGGETTEVRLEIDILNERVEIARVEAKAIKDRSKELKAVEKSLEEGKIKLFEGTKALNATDKALEWSSQANDKAKADTEKMKRDAMGVMIAAKDEAAEAEATALDFERRRDIAKGELTSSNAKKEDIKSEKRHLKEALRLVIAENKEVNHTNKTDKRRIEKEMEKLLSASDSAYKKAATDIEKAKGAEAGLAIILAEVDEAKKAREREILGMEDIKLEIKITRDKAEEDIFIQKKDLEKREGDIVLEKKWLEEKRVSLRGKKEQVEKHYGKALNIII